MSSDIEAASFQGDSGSGIEQRNIINGSEVATLMGITSYGSRNCPVNELARFTKVSNYMRKICELTGLCYSKPTESVGKRSNK